MVRARFTGPPNPDPDGNDLGYEVLILGRRTVRGDDLVEDLPGELIEELPDGWVIGDPNLDPDGDPGRYVLPKASWTVEDQPKAKARKKTDSEPAEPAKGE
jgi:hypothetical protein